jgi:hypothetical protein
MGLRVTTSGGLNPEGIVLQNLSRSWMRLKQENRMTPDEQWAWILIFVWILVGHGKLISDREWRDRRDKDDTV